MSEEEEVSSHLEEHFLIRLPQDSADEVTAILNERPDDLEKELQIKFTQPDMKHASVIVPGGKELTGRMMELPCIIESQKTLDKKVFYKVANISRLLVCKSEFDSWHDSNGQKDDGKEFSWPHGLCPPLKNVRKRRFRKTLKKKCLDAPEIEKELKRLFQSDLEAVDVKWELTNEPLQGKSRSGQSENQGDSIPNPSNEVMDSTKPADDSPPPAEKELFGSSCSSSSDEQTQDD